MAAPHVDVDSLSQTDRNDSSLSLESPAGKPVELTLPRLKRLFALAELSLDSSSLDSANKELISQELDKRSPELATQFLSRFGLQTTQDVITFLNSPEGEEMLALINEELAEIAAMNDQITRDVIEQQRFKERALAFLLLGLLHGREEQTLHLNLHMQQQIDEEKKLHSEATASSNKASEMAAKYENKPGENFEAYTQAANGIENKLQGKLKDAEKLEEKLAKMAELLDRTESKYKGYDAHLDSVHKNIAQLTDDLNVSLAQIKSDLAAVTAQMDDKGNTRNLEAATLQNRLSVRNSTIKNIQSTIKSATQLNHDDAVKIGALLDTGKRTDELRARALMEKSNERNLEIATLQDLLSVLHGDKILCKEDGSPTTSFADADLILPKENKVVEKNGKHFLLKTNQTLDDMSQDAQNDAEKQYLQLKPEMMGVKKLIKHNHELEKEEYITQKAPLDAENHRMQQNILLLANQLKHMQAAANAEALLKQPQTSPSLKMTPQSTRLTPMAATALTPIQQCFTDSYKHMLQLMRNNPSATSINWLKTSLAYDRTPELLRELNKLKPGMPISPATMHFLLSRSDLGSTWVSNRDRMDTTGKPTAEPPAESTAPTPLSTEMTLKRK